MSRIQSDTVGKCCMCLSKIECTDFDDVYTIPIKYVLCGNCKNKSGEKCRLCQKETKNGDFRNLKSIKENRISWTCQACQDNIFNRCHLCNKIVLDEEEVNQMPCNNCGSMRCYECKRNRDCCKEEENFNLEYDEICREMKEKKKKTGKCLYCGKEAAKICRGCGSYYCSSQCQINDWKIGNHKQMCKKIQGKKEIV